ncbi:hypothetical protein CONPUDRAFT_81372 [Coniophora puteana RWD-64-598 SS2]|uniref:Uncharacterized protein n=1 Tax=Coniophora puteana (strain RWD-64-598) TaxID=741705 RepID=A0A5M3MW99_CONPW|nr:uncharacterized protein CONPUDRAFT_81372 [Coniophora puteana RWD-64-598 SS2]EIW83423.1 hypothetical protein CONPUDRAFT_81372 [Coniophora puteana RWD-64-598 SS2]
MVAVLLHSFLRLLPTVLRVLDVGRPIAKRTTSLSFRSCHAVILVLSPPLSRLLALLLRALPGIGGSAAGILGSLALLNLLLLLRGVLLASQHTSITNGANSVGRSMSATISSTDALLRPLALLLLPFLRPFLGRCCGLLLRTTSSAFSLLALPLLRAVLVRTLPGRLLLSALLFLQLRLRCRFGLVLRLCVCLASCSARWGGLVVRRLVFSTPLPRLFVFVNRLALGWALRILRPLLLILLGLAIRHLVRRLQQRLLFWRGGGKEEGRRWFGLKVQ